MKEQTREELIAEMEALERAAMASVPDEATLIRGSEKIDSFLRERMEKAAASKAQITIRLDVDVIERLKELAGPDGSYQSLINRALIQWLDAQDIRALLRDEIDALHQALERAGR